MNLLSASDRSMEALLHAGSFRRMLPLRSAPRSWAQGPTIAVSRQVGARGATIGRAVGARLGWRVYDNELLDRIAQEMNVEVSALKNVDEQGTNWLQESLESLANGPRVNTHSYTHHLVHTLFTIAHGGRSIIVGRGAAHVLPGTTTLRVRLVAAQKDRIRAVGHDLNLEPGLAKQYVERKDQERTRFVREHFQCDPADPQLYDLVLNTSRFSVERCADVIVGALDAWQRQAEEGQPAAKGRQEVSASA